MKDDLVVIKSPILGQFESKEQYKLYLKMKKQLQKNIIVGIAS